MSKKANLEKRTEVTTVEGLKNAVKEKYGVIYLQGDYANKVAVTEELISLTGMLTGVFFPSLFVARYAGVQLTKDMSKYKIADVSEEQVILRHKSYKGEIDAEEKDVINSINDDDELEIKEPTEEEAKHMDVIAEQWENIKESVQNKYNMSNISYLTWIKNMQFYKIVDNTIYISVPSDQAHSLNYISIKYKDYFQNVIAEIINHTYDISFTIKHT